MNLLITGGAGFIGSHIAEQALEEKHTVFVVDDMSAGSAANVPNAATIYVETILSDNFQKIVEETKPVVIFHEAAQPSLRRSIEEPVFDATTNILGTLRVIEAAKRVGAHVIMASTSAVYAPNAMPPFWEDEPQAPNLPYGIAKYSAELYLKNAGISYTILRYSNVYGPRQVPIGENQIVPRAIGFLTGKYPNFAIYGDGTHSRDFIYVKDVANANLKLGIMKMRGLYNCGTGRSTTINELCEMLARIAGKTVEFKHTDEKPGEAIHSALMTHLIKQTGWKPRVSLEDGLRATWEWANGSN